MRALCEFFENLPSYSYFTLVTFILSKSFINTSLNSVCILNIYKGNLTWRFSCPTGVLPVHTHLLSSCPQHFYRRGLEYRSQVQLRQRLLAADKEVHKCQPCEWKAQDYCLETNMRTQEWRPTRLWEEPPQADDSQAGERSPDYVRAEP